MTVLRALMGQTATSSPQNAGQHTMWGPWDTETAESWAGNVVSQDTSRSFLTVYGCARFIADQISTLPVHTYRKRSDDSLERLPNPPIIDQPTDELDSIAWRGQVLMSLLMAGNAYMQLDYSGSTSYPYRSVLPLDPAQVSVRRERGRKIFTLGDGEFTSAQVGHIPGLMWAGECEGMSPVEAARQTIGAGMAAQEYSSRFWSQGANQSGVIEAEADMDPNTAAAMARQWARDHSSLKKSHKPGVLYGGAKWKPTMLTPEQAQFLETRKFTAAQIAAEMFMLDPSEMGYPVEGASLTYSNLETRNTRKVQVTFLPWITRVENFMSTFVPRGQFVKINVDGLLRGDQSTRFGSYAIGIKNKFMLPNEARAFENWAPIEGGDSVVEDAPTPQPPDTSEEEQ